MARYEHNNSNNRGPPSKRGRLEGSGGREGGTRSHARTGTWSPMEVGGCAVFATFFLVASKRIFKRKWILFASYSLVLVYSSTVPIYSHHLLNIRFKIFAQISIQIFDLMQNKCVYLLQKYLF
jgi:hypothetical protein